MARKKDGELCGWKVERGIVREMRDREQMERSIQACPNWKQSTVAAWQNLLQR